MCPVRSSDEPDVGHVVSRHAQTLTALVSCDMGDLRAPPWHSRNPDVLKPRQSHAATGGNNSYCGGQRVSVPDCLSQCGPAACRTATMHAPLSTPHKSTVITAPTHPIHLPTLMVHTQVDAHTGLLQHLLACDMHIKPATLSTHKLSRHRPTT